MYNKRYSTNERYGYNKDEELSKHHINIKYSATFNENTRPIANRYSYNNVEPPLNIKIQLNKNPSIDFNNDYKYRQNENNESKKLSIDSIEGKKPKVTDVDRKGSLIMVREALSDSEDEENKAPFLVKNKKNMDRKTISFKESAAVVEKEHRSKRSSSTIKNKRVEPIEELNDENQEELRNQVKLKKSVNLEKENDQKSRRSSSTIKNKKVEPIDDDSNENMFFEKIENPAKLKKSSVEPATASNSKRSSSTIKIQKNEIDQKRLFKNASTIANHHSDSSQSSSSDDEDNLEKILKLKQLNKKMPTVVHEQVEEDEEETPYKIFPTINELKVLKNENKSVERNQQRLEKEMYDLLKNKSNTIDFVMKKIPQNLTIKTRIRRTKRKMVTQYTMFLETRDGNEIPLMQTKRKRATTRVYISINALELVDKETDDFHELERYLQIPCGKLKSKSKFKVTYDNFILVNTGKKSGSIMKSLNFLSKKSKKVENEGSMESLNENFKEFLKIEYESNFYKLSQPLKFSVSLVNNTEKGANKLLEFQKLITKNPKYDKDKQKFILDFDNRVKQASVHNFQLVLANPDFQDIIILQSGKVKSDEYICDFSYPLTAFEAFGVVLSSFNRRFV